MCADGFVAIEYEFVFELYGHAGGEEIRIKQSLELSWDSM